MTTLPLPTVTFVIPCYNHGRFVAEAVRSCLDQQGASVKVVVVDDGSDDAETPAACDACTKLDPDRVVVVHQKNLGLSAARNRGAAEARTRGVAWAGGAGAYITFLDADDFIDPTFVTKLHAAFADAAQGHTENGAATSLGAVSHAYCQERLIGLADMTWAVPDWDPMLMMVTNLHPVTTLIRRECFEAVGGFDESMRGGYEDWDLWLKFVERGWRGVRVREPLFTWRRHSPTTMIVEAGQHHGRLFAQLVRNHPDLYRRYADDLHILANTLLRRGESNWLDESGEAIVRRDMKRHIDYLTGDRDAARKEAAWNWEVLHIERKVYTEREQAWTQTLRDAEQRLADRERALQAETARADQAQAQAVQVQRVYEAKPIVRLSKKVYRALDYLPGPLKRLVRGAVHGVADAAAPVKSRQ